MIWILATNFGDMKIMEFHEKEMATKKDEERDRVSLVPGLSMIFLFIAS